ncbi:hypothetical protein T440DRAFT_11239 [Plenodomus tracheiphilus IPT5]|uniref:F-box domain-containing protein n=1 Tax=Plenodomus tracheiphilus IPT5 TaxID=1408161 RepID=A0A6A7BQX3_9PLEO|nr:hypothetical protein T440DRAFT_11239 [Plenodomus tracheiphilus IPT5]
MIFHQISLSLGQSHTPPSTPQTQPTALSTTHFTPKSSSPASSKSPRSPSSQVWVREQQRRAFLKHLNSWSLDHDSSPYFHGKISIAPRASWSGLSLELGKSISCILTDSTFTDARRVVVIRLFPPQGDHMDTGQGQKEHNRQDSQDIFSFRTLNIKDVKESSEAVECLPNAQPRHGKHRSGAYKLVIRCGSGWMSARDYFNKLHFSNLHTRQIARPSSSHNRNLDEVIADRSGTLGATPHSRDTVAIQPLFHPFTRLPPELQEHILFTATSLFGTYNLCHDNQLFPQPKSQSTQPVQSCISLSTLLLISRRLNHTLTSYIFASTTFHFGLTGFTNFLWQVGPSNRPRIRRLTFHFGKLALLHCIRWLAPDHVFELFEPPVVTKPLSLQYFWRCQIQDLAQEVHLQTLTVDVRGVPTKDLRMVVRILKAAFGGVERVQFVETETDGRVRVLGEEDERVDMAREESWREMCRGYFERYRRYQYLMRFELLGRELEALEERVEGTVGFDD